ncbi:MAG: Tad domain-containing protein [Rhizobiaceae bacterium]
MYRRFSEFLACTRGNIAFMTAGSLVPLLTLTAGGLEFAEYQRIQSSMQHAADTAVMAAFQPDGRRWHHRVRRANKFFDVNFQQPQRVTRIKKQLRGRQDRKRLVLQYQASAKINRLFGEFNPFTEDTVRVVSRAEMNFTTDYAPRLVAASSDKSKSN